MGRLLSFLYAEIRAMIPYAFEQRYEDLVIRMELFVEIYNAFAYTQSRRSSAHCLSRRQGQTQVISGIRCTGS